MKISWENIVNEGFWLISNSSFFQLYGIKEFEAKESKYSFAGWWSLQFSKLILKPPRWNPKIISLYNLSGNVKIIFIKVKNVRIMFIKTTNNDIAFSRIYYFYKGRF